MGKGKRFVCILLPQLLTLVSIVFTLAIIVAGTSKNLSTNTYFLKVDTRFVTHPDWLLKIPKGNKGWRQLGLQETPAKENGIKDFYTIGLWNQCEGKFKVNKKDMGEWKIQHCGKPNGKYIFNPERLLQSVPKFRGNGKIPKKIRELRKPVTEATRAMAFCFSVSLIANATAFIIGWFGILSRVGSCIAFAFSLVAVISSIGAASIATFIFTAIAEAFEKTQKETGVTAKASTRSLLCAWLAFLAALVASIFWLATSCCCARGERQKKKERELLLNNPASRGYGPVGGEQGPPMTDSGNRYTDFPERNPIGGGMGHTQYGNTGFESYRR